MVISGLVGFLGLSEHLKIKIEAKAKLIREALIINGMISNFFFSNFG
jgi:hypothetical protein